MASCSNPSCETECVSVSEVSSSSSDTSSCASRTCFGICLRHNTSFKRPEKNRLEYFASQYCILGELGVDRLRAKKVLISGLGGLGVEIAKNVILGGVEDLTLHDTKTVDEGDLVSLYDVSDLNESRANCCAVRLGKLSQYPKLVSDTRESLDIPFIDSFHVIVLTEATLEDQLRIDKHANTWRGQRVIVADTCGVFGRVFCDFGSEFEAGYDMSGENAFKLGITHIQKETGHLRINTGVECHGLCNGDWVQIDNVEGMTEVNGQVYRISVGRSYCFTVRQPSEGWNDYLNGGTVTLLKRINKHKSMGDTLTKPGLRPWNQPGSDNRMQIHIAFRALDAFRIRHQRLPRIWDEVDAAEMFQFSKTIAGRRPLDQSFIELFSKVSQGNLCPMNSIIGGIAAQEVIKACSELLLPSDQWFYFDASGYLPTGYTLQESEATLSPQDDLSQIYTSQIRVFGKAFQERLLRQRWFLVGAGSLGCEVLKNFAKMGVGAIEGHHNIVVSEDNTIQRPDLNQQFLYHAEDKNKDKSDVLAAAVRSLNSESTVAVEHEHVGGRLYSMFNDRFFRQLDGVITATDDVESLMYVNRLCVATNKQFLITRSNGTKGELQVALPHVSETYCPREQDLPDTSPSIYAARRYEPKTADDTVQWALHHFERLFHRIPMYTKDLIENERFAAKVNLTHSPSAYVVKQDIFNLITNETPTTFADCVKWAVHRFEKQYYLKIKAKLARRACRPFTRVRSPDLRLQPIKLNVRNERHLSFIEVTARLKATLHGINSQSMTHAQIKSMIQRRRLPKDVVTARLRPPRYLISLCSYLRESALEQDIVLRPIKFNPSIVEHKRFILLASYLQALAYRILPAKPAETKEYLSSLVTPKLVTTSAVVAGLASLEVYRLAWKDLPSTNVAVDLVREPVSFSALTLPPEITFSGERYTCWDQVKFGRETEVQTLLTIFQSQSGIEISEILCDGVVIHDSSRTSQRTRLPRRLDSAIDLYSWKGTPMVSGKMLIEVRSKNVQQLPLVLYG